MNILKDFTTRSSRFTAGQDIAAADLAGDVMPLADRQARGFVGPADEPAASAPDADAPDVSLPPLKPRRGATA